MADILMCAFWAVFAVIFYTFFGYGIFAFFVGKLIPKRKVGLPENKSDYPEITVVVAAFNERDYILQKIENTFGQSYPVDKIKMIIVADGSSDGTEQVAQSDQRVTVMFDPPRRGKTAALNRAIPTAESEIVLITDANALLNEDALRNIAQHFSNPKVGGVSGEKSIAVDEEDDAASSGEGAYWKYESFLKKCDDRLGTLVGAPGEIFAFRKELFSPISEDTILDDFMLSMKIVLANYALVYEPNAIAVEHASADVEEEMKRKVRICAGGWQSMSRLPKAFFFLKNPMVSFVFWSHRVLRWAVTPFLLPVLFVLNCMLMQAGGLFFVVGMGQVVFYFLAVLGYLYRGRKVKLKGFFVPYYFWMMNYSAILGLLRHLKGNQSASWERSKRK